jgi:hypothetical protein
MEASGPIPRITPRPSHSASGRIDSVPDLETAHLLDSLRRVGFARVRAESISSSAMDDRQLVHRAFDLEQERDPSFGHRWRSHSKLVIDDTDALTRLGHSAYMQPKEYNPEDGDKKRLFRPIAEDVLSSGTLEYLIRFTARVARLAVPHVFKHERAARVGLHMISYRPDASGPAYASPLWMHKDSEPFVAVILCGLSANLGGGDNLIFPFEGKGSVISDAFKLQNDFEMLLLTNTRSWHAVTPMYSADGGPARRDVLLITFEEPA